MNDVLCDTKYLQLKQATAKTGQPWVYAHRPNARDVVVVLPATQEEILFLIEERPPLQAEGKGKYAIGLPAGLVGDERIGESIEDAIGAELLEEAGIVAESIEIIAKNISSSAGCVSETVTIAIAYVADKTIVSTPVDDGGVIVDRIWIKRGKVFDWLSNMSGKGYVLTAQTLAALYFFKMKEEEL